MKRIITSLLFLLALTAGPARADVLVFAAASLKEPLDAMAAEQDDVTISYGGSGTLARQVSLGAPADVVLLANADWMDVLIDGGHVDRNTVADFASNRLVIAGPAGGAPIDLSPGSLESALGDGRLALGLTEAVPAGIYAKAALQSLGLWDEVADQLAEVDNVRAALALIARGQAPLGVVYASDLRVAPNLAALATIPAESHPPIRYVGALVNPDNASAQAFWQALQGPRGQALMRNAGFLPAYGDAE